MKNIVDEILRWPVIVQGALGSALFWLILTGSTSLARKISTSFRGVSRVRRLDVLRTELVRYSGYASDDHATSAFVVASLLYSATNEIVKAIAVICLGFIFETIAPIFRTIGFVMALYYLVWAANAVRTPKTIADPETKIKELNDEIARLESEP